jgi:dihydroorotate dehydrogenase electron transfer subunit
MKMARSADDGSLASAAIIENARLAGNYYRISFEVPAAYLGARPGQFVMLRVDMRPDPLLGRPFSIYSIAGNGSRASCSVLYRVVGKMTALLSRKAPGESVHVLGPLGRGFDLSRGPAKALLVAGGTGIAPISFLAGELYRRGVPEIFVYYGAKSGEDLIGLDDMEKAGFPQRGLRICTEDCSRGERGLVTELLARDIGAFSPGDTCVFACGPMPMLKSLRAVLAANPLPAQVSIEERMACGMGACLACAVPAASKSGGGYVRACQEGPVFNMDEVELEC